MNRPITVRDALRTLEEKLSLTWIEGQEGADKKLRGNFPSATSQGMVGTLNCIHPNRIQLIGRAELVYLSGLDNGFLCDMVEKLFAAQPAAVILSDDIEADDLFTEKARRLKIPLLKSPLPDSQLLTELQYHLTRVMAERKTVHGVLIEVLGVGVLLTGSSAIGKSELALELISRGHRLVADDAPEFARIAPDIVSGNCPTVLQDFLEVRGLGLLNIRAMFGNSAIKPSKYLQLVIQLKRMKDEELQQIDRLKGSHTHCDILGLKIPQVTLPVAPGREMAVLVETAVRQHILRRKGYNAADDFITRQQDAIAESGEIPTATSV
ncbi:MAG: HPr(Ser) kinase/phosphatase [Gammaproteobacteria bacterium]|nr:HPr(Ser) kinase/phosphatase [Gammaproteobacteria bacterium]